jgi:hypothetical protein
VILFNIRTSLLIVLVVSVIVSSSSTLETADAGTHGRFLFLSQTLPDNSQSIIKRIGELQKQIDELRRQIETLPPGPPGSLGELVVIQREGPAVTVNGQGQEVIDRSKAQCNEDEVVTGGGFERINHLDASQNRGIIKAFAEDNAWVVTGSSKFNPISFKSFAECLRIAPQ